MDSVEFRSPTAIEEDSNPQLNLSLNDSWQLKLLPFMTRFVVAIAITFLILSIFNLILIRKSIEVDAGSDIEQLVASRLESQKILLTPDQVSGQTLLLLEAHALDNRYHQANALLMSRIWTKHMTFIIGVILTLLGAIFVLGKMSENSSEITGSRADWKIGIKSSSPGIILSTLGTGLVIVAASVQTVITVSDQPVYVSPTTFDFHPSEVPGHLKQPVDILPNARR